MSLSTEAWTVFVALCTAATIYLQLYVATRIAKMKEAILEAVEKTYLRGDTGRMAIEELRGAVAKVASDLESHQERCHQSDKRRP